MLSWFTASSTILTLTIKTTDGELEDTIQIQSDETVHNLKTLIDQKFQCDGDSQKLVFHGQTLEDNLPLSAYKIIDKSTILLMKSDTEQTQPQTDTQPKPVKKRSIFEKANPFYHSNSHLQPGTEVNNNAETENTEAPKYFDPVLNELAKFHPELPMAVMQHSKSVGELMKDLGKYKTADGSSGSEQLNEDQSLAAYYYYLSLSSISAVTSTVASSVYQNLPSKEQIASTVSAVQKLISSSKEEKAAIDRLVMLGFLRKESIEAYLACNKNEVCAAVFLYQNQETQGNDDGFIDEEKEEKKVDASVGFVGGKHDTSIVNKSAFFVQFQQWLRNIFDEDMLYFEYLLLFMRHNIADMTCLEDISCDDEQYLEETLGIENKLHRNRLSKAMGEFVKDKSEFEKWWNQTVQFKKYLLLFRKFGIWDKEELLLQIRSANDILNKIGIKNRDDCANIFKHVQKLRKRHSLYAGSDMNEMGNDMSVTTPNMIPSAYNMNYSAPPMVEDNDEDITGEKEGALTQI